MADDILGQLESQLNELGLEPAKVGEGQLQVVLHGEWRRGMPVHFQVEERHLRFTALLTGAVDEHHGDVYGYLLARNYGAGDVRFALDEAGNVLLAGRVALSVIDAGVDELLGELLMVADETFNAILRRGFTSYVEREQAWRTATGMQDNPAFPSND